MSAYELALDEAVASGVVVATLSGELDLTNAYAPLIESKPARVDEHAPPPRWHGRNEDWPMMDYHLRKEAFVTVAARPVPIEQASSFGVIVCDE